MKMRIKSKNNVKIIALVLIVLTFIVVPFVLSKYSTIFHDQIVINVRQPEYDVVFNANPPSGKTASGTMSDMHFVYGTEQNLTINAYEISGYTFVGWNTDPDGDGDFYTDGQLVDKLTSVDGKTVTLYAQWRDVIAEINGVYYNTLQAAVNAVPTNNTETIIKLLWNTSESVTVAANKNIVFDFQNYTVSNNGSSQVIVNSGTIKITNGTIRSSADYGAIDNNSGGKIVMTGGSIIATGTRQTIYNNAGGTVEISGDAYLSSSAVSTTDKERGTVQNQSGGTLTITGGTIVSTTNQSVLNSGTMTIGVEDGNIDKTSPVFIGEVYGIKSTTNFDFYNGIMKGRTAPIFDASKVVGKEAGYDVVMNNEIINGVNYRTGYLGLAKNVTFNPNGGTIDESTRGVEAGVVIGKLPVPVRTGYKFDGWFTESTGGTQITENEIITDDVTFYAHWIENQAAEINGKTYKTLAAAINDIPTDGTETVVKIINDTNENITIKKGQNVVFDLEGVTLQNTNTNAVITNNGTVTITNGSVATNSPKTSAINNNAGSKLYINGGRIIATGDRQAVYNDGGYVEISGDSYLCSSITDSSKERGTVHNLSGGTMIIKGGTIVSTTQQALYNDSGTLIIGEKDGNINSTSPIFQGVTNGIKSKTNFEFYDGIAKGGQKGIENESKVSQKEDNSVIAHSTETIDGVEYKTAYLTEN